MTLQERLYKSRFIHTNGCWIWHGETTTNGYGRLDWGGLRYRTHRLSWQIHRGPIPEGILVLHKCDNRLCFNPDHLFLGDEATNSYDSVMKGRDNPRKLTPKDASDIRKAFVAGATRKQLAAEYFVHYTTIRDIIRGRYHSS